MNGKHKVMQNLCATFSLSNSEQLHSTTKLADK